jgi:hypothetical protein
MNHAPLLLFPATRSLTLLAIDDVIKVCLVSIVPGRTFRTMEMAAEAGKPSYCKKMAANSQVRPSKK